MKHSIYSLLALGSLSLLAGCFFGSTPSKSAEGEATVKVFNVLSKELYDDAHIKGSQHLDFSAVKETAQKENWDKNSTIVFYCSNFQCSASHEAARELKELGFVNAKVYAGGMQEWYALSKQDPSFAYEGPAKQEYLMLEVAAPAADEASAEGVISAAALKELLQKAGLLG